MKTVHVFAQFEDGSRRRVPKRHWLIETIESSLDGGHHAFTLHFIDNLTDQVGTRTRLADQAFLSEFDHHALGSSGNQACFRFDKRHTRPWRGHRDFFDDGFAIAHVL